MFVGAIRRKINRTIMSMVGIIALAAMFRAGFLFLRHQEKLQFAESAPHHLDKRGAFYDASGHLLTGMEERKTAWVDLIKARKFADLHPSEWRSFCAKLAEILNADQSPGKV